MLMNPDGQLRLMTSTGEGADFVEVVRLNADSGPRIDSFTTGVAVSVPNIQKLGREMAGVSKGGHAIRISLRPRDPDETARTDHRHHEPLQK
jgi:hypothetical protein